MVSQFLAPRGSCRSFWTRSIPDCSRSVVLRAQERPADFARSKLMLQARTRCNVYLFCKRVRVLKEVQQQSLSLLDPVHGTSRLEQSLGACLTTVCAVIPLAATKETCHGQTTFSRPYRFHTPPGVCENHKLSGASRA